MTRLMSIQAYLYNKSLYFDLWSTFQGKVDWRVAMCVDMVMRPEMSTPWNLSCATSEHILKEN